HSISHYIICLIYFFINLPPFTPPIFTIHPPPLTSTLFPYTTLFRSRTVGAQQAAPLLCAPDPRPTHPASAPARRAPASRPADRGSPISRRSPRPRARARAPRTRS